MTQTNLILLGLILLLLVLGTVRFARASKSPRGGLIDAAITALVTWPVSAAMNWNGGLPVALWWVLAIWAGALVGGWAARLTPPARPGRPPAAARTAPR